MNEGDASVWPFVNRNDFEKEIRNPKYLNGSSAYKMV